jgi:pyruvate kinase
MKKTKIICTLGPVTESYGKIFELVKAGMNVARLNFSHGEYEFFTEAIKNIRRASEKSGEAIAILQDLPGPKIRVGKIDVPVQLLKGEEVILSCAPKPKKPATGKMIPVDVPILYKHVKKGDKILINDGMVQLSVVSADNAARTVKCRVTAGGEVASRKGVNLPGIALPISSITPKDKKDLCFGLKNNVDIVCLSFVRKVEDIRELKAFIKKNSPVNFPLIIAKIEKPEAMKEIDEIIDECDGIMVARGDMAVEAGYINIPEIQEKLINGANKKGKIVIVATQMLESMVNNPYPERAEITDVYNAVTAGADCLMLSAETSIGKFPGKTVRVMADIAKRAENVMAGLKTKPEFIETKCASENIISYAAALSGAFMKGIEIMVNAKTLDDVRFISDYRPKNIIGAATTDDSLYRKLALYHGVKPVIIKNSLPATVKSAALRIFSRAEKIILVEFNGHGNEAGKMTIINVSVNKKAPAGV